MRISEILYAMASFLENPNNEALLLAEHDERCLKIVAESCVHASHLLKIAAEQVDNLEPHKSNLTLESIDDLAALASTFDQSGDPELVKQAAAIDELLLTIAAPEGATNVIRQLEKSKINNLKKRYEDAKNKINLTNKAEESKKAVEKSKITKHVQQNDQPLSTRYCPDHAGEQIQRVGDELWQCPSTKKVYSYRDGFELMSGQKVPGGFVECADDTTNAPYESVFDTRNERLQTNKP